MVNQSMIMLLFFCEGLHSLKPSQNLTGLCLFMYIYIYVCVCAYICIYTRKPFRKRTSLHNSHLRSLQEKLGGGKMSTSRTSLKKQWESLCKHECVSPLSLSHRKRHHQKETHGIPSIQVLVGWRLYLGDVTNCALLYAAVVLHGFIN